MPEVQQQYEKEAPSHQLIRESATIKIYLVVSCYYFELNQQTKGAVEWIDLTLAVHDLAITKATDLSQ
jgi:hypothetical protein